MTLELSFRNWDQESDRPFDLFVATCGYEPRATHATKLLQDRILHLDVLDYSRGHVLGYDANFEYFSSLGSVIPTEPAVAAEQQYYAQMRDSLGPRHLGRAHVGIDVSSCDRQRMANLVRATERLARETSIDVTFLYSLGDFDSTLEADDLPVMINEAVVGFEGWSSDPALPVTCVVGLGYERRMALAAVETLEPALTAAFIATNTESRFEDRVTQINIEIIGSDVTPVLRYDIASPVPTLALLDSYVRNALDGNRVVLVPLGPKLFALACYLVAIVEGPEVSVWRVSADESGDEQPRLAAGPVVGLTVRFPGPA
ncbi:hypothetical protein [Plantibacter sp. YIM 135347]|uniref:hypothetical protein n=1 Tax=Plantibacter sp. YIM 135347 TaxID=3423919 RepID=UPI003D33D082